MTHNQTHSLDTKVPGLGCELRNLEHTKHTPFDLQVSTLLTSSSKEIAPRRVDMISGLSPAEEREAKSALDRGRARTLPSSTYVRPVTHSLTHSLSFPAGEPIKRGAGAKRHSRYRSRRIYFIVHLSFIQFRLGREGEREGGREGERERERV